MNKIILIAWIALFASVSTNDYARDFIKSALSNAEGKEITLADECFGPTFDGNLEGLLNFVKADNYVLIILTVQKIALDVYQNCPVAEVQSIVQIIQSKIEDQSILTDIMTKLTEVTKIIVTEYKATEHTATSVGTAAGQCVNVFIRSQQLSFLGFLQEAENSEIATVLIGGILEGLSKEGSELKCKADILNNAEKIVEEIKEAIEAIKAGTDIIQVLSKLVLELIGVSGMVGDCRIFELVKVVQTLITKDGMNALVQRVTANAVQLIAALGELINAGISQDFAKLGVEVGKMLQIVLDFYVN